MDRNTRQELNRISGRIPAHLMNVTKLEIDVSEEDLARAALKNKNISKAKREHIARLLDKGKFRRVETVTNEEVVAELDKFHTNQIARARKEGRLPDPMTDPFYRRRMERLQRIRDGKEKPKKVQLTESEKQRAGRILRQGQNDAKTNNR